VKKKKKVKKEDTTLRKGKKKAEGFIKKFEEQVDILDFIDWELNYSLDIDNPIIYCPFCHGNTPSLKIDKKKKNFSCSICGLKGGLVLFIMLYHKVSLRKALKRIASFVPTDVSIIPHHALIP
jgi:DNA primase